MLRSLAPTIVLLARSRPPATLAAALLAGSLAGCVLPRSGEADTVYVNGKVVTVDRTFSIAQAPSRTAGSSASGPATTSAGWPRRARASSICKAAR